MNDKSNESLKEERGFLKKVLNRIKRIKHIDIILTVLFVVIILLIYFSTFSFGSVKNNESTNETTNTTKFTELDNNELTVKYSKEIENKLYGVISRLKDVGQVSVAVKLNGDINYEYAYSTKVETLENGTKVETKTPIITSDNNKSAPLVLHTIMPSVESIVVIATGAKNTNVRLDILRVVQLLYNIPSSKIEIFVGN